MYRELIVFPAALKDQIIYPETARSLVAKSCDGLAIDPEVFTRQPDGTTRQGVFGHHSTGEGYGIPPAVVFNGGRGFIRLYGIGQRGSELVSREAPQIATAISLHTHSPYTFTVNTGECALEDRGYAQLYGIKTLIVAKKKYQFAALTGGGLPTLTAMTPLIQRAIVRGIISQARLLDTDAGRPAKETVIGTDEMLDIRVLAGKPVFVPIKTGARIHALGVRNVVFSINLNMTGPWVVGHLRSRGFGLIKRVRG